MKEMSQDLKNRIALAPAGHAVMCKHLDLISSKVIYDEEFESRVAEDFDSGFLLLTDKGSRFQVVDAVWQDDGQTLKRGKKYKVTLKIEEVE